MLPDVGIMWNFTAETQSLRGEAPSFCSFLCGTLRNLCVSAVKNLNRQRRLKYQSLIVIQKISLGCWLIILLTFSIFAQDLPDKIRGYKVHNEKITIQDEPDDSRKNGKLNVEVKLANPELADISALGVKLELGGEITVSGQSGTVDFISFKDFEVNGITVEIEEYKDAFDFKKNIPFKLEKPIEMLISTAQTLRGAWKEIKDSKEDWLVTGKIFVFGRFKKFGFNFKRVVPVEVKIKIPNPVKSG